MTKGVVYALLGVFLLLPLGGMAVGSILIAFWEVATSQPVEANAGEGDDAS